MLKRRSRVITIVVSALNGLVKPDSACMHHRSRARPPKLSGSFRQNTVRPPKTSGSFCQNEFSGSFCQNAVLPFGHPSTAGRSGPTPPSGGLFLQFRRRRSSVHVLSRGGALPRGASLRAVVSNFDSNPSPSYEGGGAPKFAGAAAPHPLARPYDRAGPVSGRDGRSMTRTGVPFGAPPRRCVFPCPRRRLSDPEKPFGLPDPAGFRLRSSAPPDRQPRGVCGKPLSSATNGAALRVDGGVTPTIA
jgi:hypothetical protein